MQALSGLLRQLHRATVIFLNEKGGAVGKLHGRPLYLEAAIGLPSEGAGTALDSPDPVKLTLPSGKAIMARARLDRIDAIEQSGADGRPRFAIIDYKSGRYVKPFDLRDVYNQGRLLQHVIYMALAERALRAQAGEDVIIDGFAFLFPDVRTHGRAVVFGYDIVPKGLEVIETLCVMAARGVFPTSDDDDDAADCRFCDFKPTCRSVNRNLKDLCHASARKRSNDKNKILKEFVELRVD